VITQQVYLKQAFFAQRTMNFNHIRFSFYIQIIKSIPFESIRLRLMKSSVVFLLLLWSVASLGQADLKKLKEQAEETAQATVEGKYEDIIKYTHPNLLKMMGGRDAMLDLIQSAMEEVKKQGVSIESVTMGEPGATVQAGDEIHCILPQTLIMKVGDKRMRSDGNLLCISQDNGKNWFFLDMGGVDASSIKTILPNYNADLKFPEKKQPVFID
jgi:hypothetical protein